MVFIGGYLFVDGLSVIMEIGINIYELFIDGEWVWVINNEMDVVIVVVMKCGVDVVLMGCLLCGIVMKDMFLLLGFIVLVDDVVVCCN